MLRNDYRRAMIMLRGLEKGMGGFIRLERRTLMGSMQFTVSGSPQGMMLNAVMLSQKGGQWSVAPLGTMRRDSRGQAGLTWSFDPRNIQGKTLEDYDVVAVVNMNGERCRLLLIGFVNSSKEVDVEQVRMAIERTLGARTARSASSVQTEAASTQSDAEAAEDTGDMAQTTESAAAGQTMEAEDSAEYADDLPQQADAQQQTDEDPLSCCCDEAQEPQTEEAQQSASAVDSAESAAQTQEAGEDTVTCCCDQAELGELDVPAQEENSQSEGIISDEQAQALLMAADNASDFDEDLEVPAQEDQSAGGQQEVDTDAIWPESVEPLRSLFKTEERIYPFPSRFIFIGAALPAETGLDYCAVGIRCQNGLPYLVCYALPARFEIEPPPGLEGYSWKGDTRQGWWVTWQTVDSGEMLEESQAEAE